MMVLPCRGEKRERTAAPGRAKVPLRSARVVTRHDRDVHDLLEPVPARLAGLELEQVEHLVLPIQDQVVEPQEDRATVSQAGLPPTPLGFPPTLHCDRD